MAITAGEIEIILRADSARLRADMDRADRITSASAARMSQAASQIKVAFAGIAAGIGLSQLVQMTDQYTKFTAQLRLASISAREYSAAYADVKRIATTAQQDLASTGTLYARIASGTRELGTTQKQVAAITETVNLALKVSGATATESASAQLQLSQAFASGTLRGEEFNAVNEAAPRLMQALADGIGVPVGALKKMAEEGAITSKMMSDVLPHALARLREEAKEVQTISGAFTVLKSNVMEFVGIQANASGTVSTLTTAITGLADNLGTIASAALLVAAAYSGKLLASLIVGANAKLNDLAASRAQAIANEEAAGSALRRAQAERQAALITQSRARETVASVRAEVAADRQRVASAVVAAEQQIVARQAQFAATATIIRQEIALEQTRLRAQINSIGRAERVAELARLSVQLSAIEKSMAAQSAALAAQRIAGEQAVANAATVGAGRIAAARAAETVATGAAAAATLQARAANAALTAAMGATAIASRALSGALVLVGGPIGAITLALTLGITAWSLWGNKAKEESDKAGQAVEESTAEMIARLDKQIEKLKERNRLQEAEPRIKSLGELSDADKDGLARAKSELDAARNGTGAYAEQSATMRQLAEIDLIARYETALLRITQRQDELTAAENRGRDAKIAKWNGENGTAAQKEAYEIANLTKEYGQLTPAMLAWVKAKHADKGVAANNKAALTANLDLLRSGIDADKALRAEGLAEVVELNRQGLASDAQLYAAKAAAAIAAGTDVSRVKQAEIEELRRYNGKDEAERKATIGKIQVLELEKTEAVRASLVAADLLRTQYAYDSNKAERDAQAAADAQIAAAAGESVALQAQFESYGKLPAAITAASIAKLEARGVALEVAGAYQWEIDKNNELIAALQNKAKWQAQVSAQDTGSDVTKAKELLDILTAVDAATKSAADGMAASFGRVGSAIGSLTTALSGYAVQQQAIAAQLAVVKADPKNGPEKIARAEIAAAAASAQAKVKSYGDMAGAAKTFFKENTAGYRALEGAEKAYRAVEMAMAIESMVRKLFAVNAVTAATVTGEAAKTAAVVSGTAVQVATDTVKGTSAAAVAVATQASGDPYSAWVRMAAMAAAMAALGFAVAGGGGKGDTTAKDRQKAAGTGSILGDKDAKSESISRALELAASNSSIELTYTRGMLESLRSIESSLSGLGNLLVRNSGLTGEMAPGSKGAAYELGSSKLVTAVLGGPIGLVLDKLTGGLVGKITGSVFGKIFGGKVTTLDTGVTAGRSSLGGVLANGISVDQYTDIKKSGGLFSSSKNSTQSTPLGAEANDQFAKVIAGLAASVTEAGKLLGLGGDEFTKRLNSFVVDIGKISLKGLTGEEIQKQLETVFSKLGDDLAAFAVGGLEQFQQVGEGYFETLTRIATNYANLDSILAASGTTFGQVGLQSIAARERLIGLAGGIDELASKSASFNENFLTEAQRLAPVQKYVTDQLAAMGLAGIDTRDKFRDTVLGLANSGALATEAGAKQYAGLLDLAEAFAKVYAATEDLTKSQQAIADERKSLQAKLDELTMTSTQLRERERATIAAANLALYDSIAAIEAMKDAAAALIGGVDDAFAGLQRAVEREKAARAKSHEIEMKALQARIDAQTTSVTKLRGLSESLHSALDQLQVTGTAAGDGGRAEAQAQIKAALAIANAGGTSDAEALKKALSVVTKDASEQFATYQDYLRDFYTTQNDIASLGKVTDIALSVSEQSLRVLEAQKLAADEAYKAEIARLDGIVESARTQIDVLKGMDTSLLTIDQSLQAVIEAISKAQQNPVNSVAQSYQDVLGRAPDKAGLDYWQQQAAAGMSPDKIKELIGGSAEAKVRALYKDLLGRSGDAAGVDYWTKAVNSGASIDAVKAAIKASDEYKKLHKVPGFVSGGDFGGGLRLVGERGPELEVTGPSRIFNADQTAEMMQRYRSPSDNSAALLEELRAQRKENQELREMMESHLYAIAKHTLSTADTLDAAANGGVPLEVKESA